MSTNDSNSVSTAPRAVTPAPQPSTNPLPGAFTIGAVTAEWIEQGAQANG